MILPLATRSPVGADILSMPLSHQHSAMSLAMSSASSNGSQYVQQSPGSGLPTAWASPRFFQMGSQPPPTGLLTDLDLQHDEDLVAGALGLQYSGAANPGAQESSVAASGEGTAVAAGPGSHTQMSRDALLSRHMSMGLHAQQYHMQSALHGFAQSHLSQYLPGAAAAAAAAAAATSLGLHRGQHEASVGMSQGDRADFHLFPLAGPAVQGPHFPSSDQHAYAHAAATAGAGFDFSTTGPGLASYTTDPARHTAAALDPGADASRQGLTAAKLASLPSNVAEAPAA
jgi:hypothetical protein